MKTDVTKNAEKLKCIKNTKTGKVQRLPKSSCDDIIADNPDWHYTSKSAYEKALVDAIPAGPSTHPNSFNGKPKGKAKGIRRDVRKAQVIVEVVENPDFNSKVTEATPVYNKPRKAVAHKSLVYIDNKPKVVETTIIKKVPDDRLEARKVIGFTEVPEFLTKIKRIYHLIVDGKMVKDYSNR